jgi:hypothetical protein
MAWRDLADQLDKVVVTTFDYGDITFQKVASGVPSGEPVPVPAEYIANAISIDVQDGNQVSSLSPAVTFRLVDLGNLTCEVGDRFILASGAAAGTYEVDDVQPDDDRTGATAKLKRLT